MGQSPVCEFYCGTFSDNDRGYFPRAGLVDRRYNPRTGMQLIKQVNTLLSEFTEINEPVTEAEEHLVSFKLGTADKAYFICIPDEGFGMEELEKYLDGFAGQISGLRLLDLVSNEYIDLESKSGLSRAFASNHPCALLN